MKKQIYLLRHNNNPSYKYVGATSLTLREYFSRVWGSRLWNNRPLYKAMRGTWRNEWSITQLHDYTEDWQRLEAKHIKAHKSYTKGLNAYPTGQGANSPVNCKKVLRSDGVIYDSASIAARETGIDRSDICKVCRGVKGSAGGYTWQYVNNLNQTLDKR